VHKPDDLFDGTLERLTDPADRFKRYQLTVHNTGDRGLTDAYLPAKLRARHLPLFQDTTQRFITHTIHYTPPPVGTNAAAVTMPLTTRFPLIIVLPLIVTVPFKLMIGAFTVNEGALMVTGPEAWTLMLPQVSLMSPQVMVTSAHSQIKSLNFV